MSDEDDLSPEPEASGPPKASKDPILAFSLEGKDNNVEAEEEGSEDENLPILKEKSTEREETQREEEYLEEETSLEEEEDLEEGEEELEEEEDSLEKEEDSLEEEEDYLVENDYLDEETFFQRSQYLLKKAFVEEKKYLEEELKAADPTAIQPKLRARSPAASTSQGINFQIAAPLISEWDKFTSPSYYSRTRIPVSLRDQSSQTEWAYESKLGTPLRSQMRLDQDSMISMSKKSELEAFEANETEKEEDDSSDNLSQGSLWDIIMNETGEKQEEDVSDSLPSSYQSVFKEILSEMATQNEFNENLDIPLNKLLEGENRKKLGLLLKKNFENYKGAVAWLLRKHDSQKLIEKTTFTYRVSIQQEPRDLKPKEPKKRTSAHPPRPKKKLELDTEWTQSKMKVHQGDGNLILYPSGNIFQIFFPNGTGQIHYPSGNPAMLISYTEVAKVTYIVLEDNPKNKIRGLINNSGHATFYDENGAIWASLSKLLGYYFPKDKQQKAWNWWNLDLHVHAPPIKCITLKLNKYIQIQIRSQNKVIFSFFTPKQRRVCLNMGTKFKSINSKLLRAMKKKTVLETDPRPTSWKIQVLLGKISQILNYLTISDLEDFTEATKLTLKNISAMRSQIWF